ncbi:MAG: class I SAM-dependent methyltransferase [Planctomycetes bacterium]|nr:class I SAM-dependent methyltransferase [Planctomycetota bacterium]
MTEAPRIAPIRSRPIHGKATLDARIRDILALLETEARGRLLEVGCGTGWMLPVYASMGFRDVRGTNYEIGHWPRAKKAEGFIVEEGIDIAHPSRLAGESFDALILSEVLEHIPDHAAAVRGAARILAPGGALILTTPNIHRLSSRLRFFLSGFHKVKRKFIRYACPLDESFRYHNWPVHLPYLDYVIERSGLRIEDLRGGRIKAFSALLTLLLRPIVGLYTRGLLAQDDDPAQREAYARLRGLLVSRAALAGDNLIIKARRIEDPDPRRGAEGAT